MTDEFTFTKEQQINTVKKGFRHVVILGAGASKASTIDNPEKNKKSLPLMNDLPKIIDLREELADLPRNLAEANFEAMFSKLFKSEPGSIRLKSIQNKIYNYFKNLELPDTPTIYDYLVLSLRKKDLIATFNWDPFLIQAYLRNIHLTKDLPQLTFLHGNVAVGFCQETNSFGPLNHINPKTNKLFFPTKLLYPIDKKNIQMITL